MRFVNHSCGRCSGLSLLILIGGAVSALAADPIGSDELINRLQPHHASRGLLPRGVQVEGADTANALPSVDLSVSFEFNSAQLTTDAMLTLDQLGAALGNPALAAFRFQIAGHTDGIGTQDINQTLSEQRAFAVKNYLVTRHGIAADRLETIGYGKTRLLDPAHPDAAINRRVQVTNMGGR